jgi:hypothetical protein
MAASGAFGVTGQSGLGPVVYEYDITLAGDETAASLYPIAILIDELKHEDPQFRLNSMRRIATIGGVAPDIFGIISLPSLCTFVRPVAPRHSYRPRP